MFDYIKGELSYKISGNKGHFATVEVAGVGYSFEMSEKDFVKLPQEGEKLKVYLVLIHREDRMSLCGFLKREERDLYNVLTSVSGVGAKMALTLINSFDISTLVELVLDGNYKELTKAKGVGPKLAQKIILELKDKITNNNVPVNSSNNVSNNFPNSESVSDAQMVMLSLGYEKDEINVALQKVLNKLEKNAPAEDILRESLKLLSV